MYTTNKPWFVTSINSTHSAKFQAITVNNYYSKQITQILLFIWINYLMSSTEIISQLRWWTIAIPFSHFVML